MWLCTKRASNPGSKCCAQIPETCSISVPSSGCSLTRDNAAAGCKPCFEHNITAISDRPILLLDSLIAIRFSYVSIMPSILSSASSPEAFGFLPPSQQGCSGVASLLKILQHALILPSQGQSLTQQLISSIFQVCFACFWPCLPK